MNSKRHKPLKYVNQCEPNLVHINNNKHLLRAFHLRGSIKQYDKSIMHIIIWKQ